MTGQLPLQVSASWPACGGLLLTGNDGGLARGGGDGDGDVDGVAVESGLAGPGGVLLVVGVLLLLSQTQVAPPHGL